MFHPRQFLKKNKKSLAESSNKHEPLKQCISSRRLSWDNDCSIFALWQLHNRVAPPKKINKDADQNDSSQ